MKKLVKKLVPNSLKLALRKYRYDGKKSMFYQKSAKEAFTEIYDTNHWKGKESISGTGSDMGQTESLIKKIDGLIDDLKIQSILDLPCGDYKWMKSVKKDGITYIGGDIVDDLIDNNNKTYKGENIRFEVINLISDPLPKSDIIICRDCLVHLSYADIFAALHNIKSSGCKYLLTTSFINHNLNFDIVTGDWRTLNLQIAPFNFPEPLKCINEECTEGDGEYQDKSLLLYRIDDIHLAESTNTETVANN